MSPEKNLKATLHKFDGSEQQEILLNERLFGEEINKDLLYRAVQMQLTNLRQGTHSTKMRGEVAGGGRKPWPQKYTGRARHGSRRSPIWRGGGITFGPKPKEYEYRLPRKMRQKAIRMALTAKYQERQLALIDKIAFEKPKTKDGLKLLERFNFPAKVLVIVSKDENIVPVKKSFSNIPNVRCLATESATVYDLLKYESLLLTQNALKELEARYARSVVNNEA